jgi:hypothetical protein
LPPAQQGLEIKILGLISLRLLISKTCSQANNCLPYTHIKIWVARMKTTIEVSDILLEQAKRAAREQGVSLRTIFERGLQMALQPPAKLPKSKWPDLTFKPTEKGNLMAGDKWRDAVNDVPGWTAQ